MSFLSTILSAPNPENSRFEWPGWTPEWILKIQPTMETYPVWTALTLVVVFYMAAKII